MRRSTPSLLPFILMAAVWLSLAPYAGSGPALAHGARTVPAIPRSLIVIKRFGAALRISPSSNAPIVYTLPCGVEMRVRSQSGGWYRVVTIASDVTNGASFDGWVGGARVANAANPPAYDCTDSYTFQVGEHAYSYVKSGCLSLRVTPSRAAAYHYCVRNFHDYIIGNGPIEVAGEDWFGVYSPSTGDGWSLARYLLPYHMNG